LDWNPVSYFIFISIVIIVIYAVGVWVGTHLEKALQADRTKEAKKKEEAKKKVRRR